MTTRLHQILAVRQDVNNRQNRTVTSFYQRAQKRSLFEGMNRNYQPFVDAPENQVPSESVLVQANVDQMLAGVLESMGKLFDINATIDATNTRAMAAVVLEDGTQLTPELPSTHLLFLEKQLVDVRTIINALPVLDPAFVWSRNEQTGLYQTDELKTLKTKKEKKVLIAYQATDKHPAQVATYDEDVPVGTWVTRKLFGGIPETRKAVLLSRVDAMIVAVKKARELANSVVVEDVKSSSILDYIFA